MKNLIIPVFISAFILITSCKNDKRGDLLKSNEVNVSQNDANEIIRYNNAVVKLVDGQHQYLKRLNENMVKIEKGLQKPDDRFAFIGLVLPPYIESLRYDDAKPEEPGKVFSKEERDFFGSNVKTLNKTFRNIQDSYDQLMEYIKAEDYKDDAGKQGKQAIVTIDSLRQNYGKITETVYKKLTGLADSAERKVLEDHPLKDYIFAFKDDSKAVAEFVNLAFEKAQDYKANETEFKEAYDKIENLNTKHKQMKVPDASRFPIKDSYFKNFNEAVNEFLIDARKIMRNAASSGQLTPNDLETFKSNEDYIRKSYNNFVD